MRKNAGYFDDSSLVLMLKICYSIQKAKEEGEKHGVADLVRSRIPSEQLV